MFKIKERPQFRWRIEFKWAGDQHYETHEFVAVFRRLPAKELSELAGAVQKSGYGFDERVAFVDAVVVGFDEIEHDGTPQQLRAWMLDDMTIVNALFTTYSQVIQGIEVKNSETPPAALSA